MSPQREYVGRPVLPDDTLCHRRERALLACAIGVLASAILLIALGTDTTISLAEMAPFELTPNALLPAGTLALPLAPLAAMLACEVLGPRSARALAGTSIVAMAIALGVIAALGRGTAELSLATGFVVEMLVTIELFSAIGKVTRGHKLWLRYLASSLIGAAAGGVALATASTAFPLPASIVPNAIAANVAGYTAAIALVAWLPMMLVMRWTTIALRTKPFRKVYTTEEIAFFDRGDRLDDLIEA